MRQRFSSVALVDDRGWVLLQERDEHPVIDPEKWGFVGGHVEPDEEYAAAAYRELAEETGIVLTGELRLVGTYDVWHEHSRSTDEFTLWTARVALSDADVETREGRRIVFVDPATISGLPLTASCEVALAAFVESDLYQEITA